MTADTINAIHYSITGSMIAFALLAMWASRRIGKMNDLPPRVRRPGPRKR